jgi:thioesterase domain-containing protein
MMMSLSFEQMKNFVEKPFAFVERIGLKALVLERGRVRLAVPLKGNVNHIGSMYAGALFTLAEIPGGALFLTSFDTDRFYPVVKEMTIRFIKPVTTEATVEILLDEAAISKIQADADAFGKAEYILEGQIRDADGRLVAESRGIYQLRSLTAQ